MNEKSVADNFKVEEPKKLEVLNNNFMNVNKIEENLSLSSNILINEKEIINFALNNEPNLNDKNKKLSNRTKEINKANNLEVDKKPVIGQTDFKLNAIGDIKNIQKEKSYTKFKLDFKKVHNKYGKFHKIRMNYNVCEIIMKYVCGCCPNDKQKLKTNLYNQGYKKFSYHMDILSFIRKMHEIDIIKYLVLDENHTTLFKFISKPSISLASKNPIIDNFHKKIISDFNKKEIEGLNKSFYELSNNPQRNEFDTRLLKIVGFEIDNLIAE